MNNPQNLSETDLHWYDLIPQCRTSRKSEHQWLAENNTSPQTEYSVQNEHSFREFRVPFSGKAVHAFPE